jgi:dipeptide/tripeptide permease
MTGEMKVLILGLSLMNVVGPGVLKAAVESLGGLVTDAATPNKAP